MSVARERLRRQIKALESITLREFVSVWQSSEGLASAVGFLSVMCGLVLTPAVVEVRATHHRNDGLLLKKMS